MSSTFLVAESDNAIRSLISDILKGKGHEVFSTSDFDEAVEIIARHDPVTVFAAQDLSGRNGVSLIDEARKRGREVPLVLIVDGSQPDVGKLAHDLGADTYLKKPVDKSRLEMLIRIGIDYKERIIRERRRVQELSLTRSFLGALLDTGGEAAFLLDAAGSIREVSEAGAGILHSSPATLSGRSYLDALPSLSAGLQREAMAKVKETRLTQHIEEYRGGAVYSTTIRPVFVDKALAGYSIVTSDITALRRSEVGLAESEKRYRSVYEASRDAIIMLDRNDGSILDCNTAARRLYGYTSADMLKLSIRDLSDEPKRSMEAMRNGIERVPIRYHRKKDGRTFPVEISMSHFVHDGREVSTAYIRDLSQRKAVEEALREGAQMYRAVVEDQTELICRYSPEGELSFVNGAYARFFGVDEDGILGKKFFPRLAENERRDLKTWLREAGRANSVFDREQRVKRADGEERWILWTNRAILNHRGAVIEIQAIGRDITERKEAEDALDKATAEKEQYRLNLEATFRSIPDAIVTVDSGLHVIATNSAAATLLGIDRGLADKHDVQELMGQGSPCVGVLKQVLRTNKSVRGYEAELEVPSLGERTVELNCTPLLDQDQQHAGAVLVVRDVSRIADLEKRLHERHGFRGIIGRSTQMQDIYKLLEQLSSLDSIVLILGESGTGKELVAEALHYGGSRAAASLIKVNCSALSESLLESELFGHVRGAFTGAVRDKVGRIQAAQGGTLFLDEIGDISPLIQLKLLRFLEQKEYERVGESKTFSADVRIIAATNVDLQEAVRQGTFREDLYYRLNVMPVLLPPLRERPADIPLLVDHFLEVFSGQFGKSFSRISQDVMDLFMTYGWPGNVRELRHILEHACILSPGTEIALKHMRRDLVDQMRTSSYMPPLVAPQAIGAPADSYVLASPGDTPFPVQQFARKASKAEILEALDRCGGNKAKAARMLGIHRATLYRKLKAWGFDD